MSFSTTSFYILTPQLLGKISQFADQAWNQIAVTFCGPAMYVAVHRSRSMFDGNVDEPIAKLRQDILADARLLKTAGDLLLSETASLKQ